MANTIIKMKRYATLLDEAYQRESLTNDLTSDPTTARQGANVNEIIIPKMDMDGLGNYDHANGYDKGQVTMTQETVTFNYERGRQFSVDAIENEESADLAFGQLAKEFLRTKVIPEGDAFTFATLADKAGIKHNAQQAITDGKALVKALSADLDEMDDAEVPMDGRILYITSTMKSLLDNMQLIESQKVLDRVSKVVVVPKGRFYTKIDLAHGGMGTGGYSKNSSGEEINYLIAHKSAVLKFDKHVAPKVITPSQNQDADAWKFGYRRYGLVDVYENKAKAIAVNSKANL